MSLLHGFPGSGGEIEVGVGHRPSSQHPRRRNINDQSSIREQVGEAELQRRFNNYLDLWTGQPLRGQDARDRVQLDFDQSEEDVFEETRAA